MAGYSRREFIAKSSVCGFGALGAAGMLSLSEGGIAVEKADSLNVDTKTGATTAVNSMPSIDDCPEIYDVDESRILPRIDDPVAVIKSADAEQAAYDALELLKPSLRADRAFLKINTSTHPVTDQPDLLKEKPYYYMTTTQPEFVKGVIEWLHDQGMKYENITVGDGVLIDTTTPNMAFFGFPELTEKMGVKLADLTKEERIGYRIKHGTLLPAVGIAKVVSDHFQDGVVVNIPKLKVHHLATITLSIKNMMGCIQKPDCRYVMHLEFHTKWSKNIDDVNLYYEVIWGLSNRLIDLYSIAPDFSVIDGIIGGEGHGVQHLSPWGEQITFPVESHRAFASTNSVNLDAVGAYFMGHNPMVPKFDDLGKMKFIPWLYAGQQKKYGYMYVHRIKILGDASLIEPEHRYQFLPELVNTMRSRERRSKEKEG